MTVVAGYCKYQEGKHGKFTCGMYAIVKDHWSSFPEMSGQSDMTEFDRSMPCFARVM